MNNKQYLEEIDKMIKVMYQNHFLLPNSWSDTINLDEHDWSYRTYCDRSSRIYINLEIYEDAKKVYDVKFRSHEIELNCPLGKVLKESDVYNYVKIIYDEKHSFSEHDTGIKSLSAKITQEKRAIKNSTEKIENYKKEIEGLKQLKTK